MLGPGHGQVKPASLMSLYDATARQVHFAGHDFLVSGSTLQLAEKVDAVLDFGWRGGLTLRSASCFEQRLQPVRSDADRAGVFPQPA